MKLTYIEIEASAEEMKNSNSLSDNLFATLNNALYKARFATAEPIEEEEIEDDDDERRSNQSYRKSQGHD